MSYDLARIQQQEVQYRLDLLARGISRIDAQIVDEKKRLEVGTSTLIVVSELEAVRAKLEDQTHDLQQQAALLHVVPTEGRLADLLLNASRANRTYQHLLADQAKKQNWDVSLTMGVGSNPSYPMLHSLPTETFGTLQLTYSFGASKRNRALDAAADHYADYQDKDDLSPIQLGYALKEQISNALVAANHSAVTYSNYGQTLESNLETVKDIDTAAARAFRVQILIEQVNNDIEEDSNLHAIRLMTGYLTYNFPE